jgi:hypothetical protein
VEIVKDCNNCSQIFGGDSKKKKSKDVKILRKIKKKYSISRLCKLTNIEGSLSKKRISV